jgi:hypothetical protein
MTKLEAALAAIQRGLHLQKPLHHRAVRRMRARHREQVKFERQRQKAEDAAERLRAAGHPAKAARKEDKAQRLNAKAEKAKAKAIVWKQRARRKVQQIHKLTVRLEDVQKEIAALGPVVDLQAETVSGGTFAQRWQKACLTAVECCSTGRRRNAYNETRPSDILHPFGPGPAADIGDDCSSFGRSMALSTGADDPSGNGFSPYGYTGDMLLAHGAWKEVSLAEMHRAGQGYVFYGSGTARHVECYCPSPTDIERTVGHGSAPVDFGTVHLFGPGEVERYLIFVEH